MSDIDALLNYESEDLDYDLDPNDEAALLNQDSDEDDILELNLDEDQMDVTDGKLDVSTEKPKNQENVVDKLEKQICLPEIKNIPQNNQQLNKRRITRAPRRYGRNDMCGVRPPRRNHYTWESTPSTVSQPPPYVQPWLPGNIPNPPVTFQQNTPANLNFNPSAFIMNNQAPYPYTQTQQVVHQPFQTLLNQQVMPNQNLHQNHPMPTLQPFMQANQYVPIPPQMPVNQQVQEPRKLPVHLRLGVQKSQPLMHNNLNEPLIDNNQVQYDRNQNLEYSNQFNPENHNFPPFVHQNDMNHLGRTHNIQQYVKHQNDISFNKNPPFKKTGLNAGHQKTAKVNKVVPIVKSKNVKTISEVEPQKRQQQPKQVQQQIVKPAQLQDLKQQHNVKAVPVVVSLDEDEETRRYRLRIEEQKRQREEFLRKKEENRLKSLAQEEKHLADSRPIVHKPVFVQQPVVHDLNNLQPRKFKEKRFEYQVPRNIPQNHQFKTQHYTNNIVLTGNDNYHQSGQRNNRNWRSLSKNQASNVCAQRIVTETSLNTNIISSHAETHKSADVTPSDLSSFLANRSVCTQDPLTNTNIVVVKNLATATNENKLRNLCRNIGDVQLACKTYRARRLKK